jgi:hypothetical protein
MTTTSMGLHASNIDSTGASADLIQIGQQVCGAISPNVSPSVLTPYIYGRNVYTGRIHPLNWRRAYPCHVGAGRHFGSVRGRHLLPRRRGRAGGTTHLYSNSPNISSTGPGSEIGTAGFDRPDNGDAQRPCPGL